MKPWREITVPHRDVPEGTFQQSEFAADITAVHSGKAKAARKLGWRLYTLCERKNWADDARASNEVVTSWSAIETAAAKESTQRQGELFA